MIHTKYAMQCVRSYLSVVLMLLVTNGTGATETKDLHATVRILTRQLAADQLADRDHAEQQLLALGPSILTVLPDDQVRLPAEASRRLS